MKALAGDFQCFQILWADEINDAICNISDTHYSFDNGRRLARRRTG